MGRGRAGVAYQIASRSACACALLRSKLVYFHETHFAVRLLSRAALLLCSCRRARLHEYVEGVVT
jgi:hypothetical protein